MFLKRSGGAAELVIGSTDHLQIDVSLVNGGEDAFDTNLYLTLPVQVDFIRVESASSSYKISCLESDELLDDDESVLMSCQIGNPLQAKRSAVFSLVLQPNAARMNEDFADGSKDSLHFTIHVNSSSPESNATLGDNRKQIGVRLVVKNNLSTRASVLWTFLFKK